MIPQADHEVNHCATYWQIVHAPEPMPEPIRGQSSIRKLFVAYFQSEWSFLPCAKTMLTQTQDPLLQAGTFLADTILSRYSLECSDVADSLQRTADTFKDESGRLERITSRL